MNCAILGSRRRIRSIVYPDDTILVVGHDGIVSLTPTTVNGQAWIRSAHKNGRTALHNVAHVATIGYLSEAESCESDAT